MKQNTDINEPTIELTQKQIKLFFELEPKVSDNFDRRGYVLYVERHKDHFLKISRHVMLRPDGKFSLYDNVKVIRNCDEYLFKDRETALSFFESQKDKFFNTPININTITFNGDEEMKKVFLKYSKIPD